MVDIATGSCAQPCKDISSLTGEAGDAASRLLPARGLPSFIERDRLGRGRGEG